MAEGALNPADAVIAEYLRTNGPLRTALDASVDAELLPQRIGWGEHNLNYRIDVPGTGRAYVLRVNVAPQPFHANQVSYEFAALTALAPSGCTPEPVYLDDSPEAPGKGALVIGFCDGNELDFDNLRPGDVRCAVQMMANVHAVPVSGDCPLHRPTDPLRGLYEECLQRFEAYRTSAFEDARITRWAELFIAKASEVLDEPFTPSDSLHIVNTEALPSHFLIPETSAAQAASAGSSGAFCTTPGSFVDWERPIVGEVAQDVAYFVSPTTTFWDSEFLFPADQVEDAVEGYWHAVDGRFARGGFDKRFKAWRMMTALRSTTWCCRALSVYRPGSQEHQTDKTARKLPVYLSEEFMGLIARDCFGL